MAKVIFFVYIKHFLRAWLPNLIVTGMSEQANANDNVSFERQAFLDFHELLLEAGAATECDYLIVLYHCLFAIICLFDKLEFTSIVCNVV